MLAAYDLAALPFRVRRVFALAGTSATSTRGGHAHRKCAQVVWAAAGTAHVSVTAPNGRERTWRLTLGEGMLHVPPKRWVEIHGLRDTDRVVVLCSDPYDAADYVKDRTAFLAMGTSPDVA